jgi:hypothetical protein
MLENGTVHGGTRRAGDPVDPRRCLVVHASVLAPALAPPDQALRSGSEGAKSQTRVLAGRGHSAMAGAKRGQEQRLTRRERGATPYPLTPPPSLARFVDEHCIWRRGNSVPYCRWGVSPFSCNAPPLFVGRGVTLPRNSRRYEDTGRCRVRHLPSGQEPVYLISLLLR